jgi:hypothetical protein
MRMSRDRRSSGFFLLMIAACGTNQASKWIWVPPPHWECLSSQG